MNKQFEAFLNGDKPDVPFDLAINNSLYRCVEILRWLPGKRLVVKAQYEGESIVLKIFAKAMKGQRELNREYSGYQLARKAALNVPELQFISDENKDYCAIAYQFLEQAAPFYDDRALLGQYVEKLFYLVSTMHNAGIYQQDFHLDNILISEEELLLIDHASIKSESVNQPLSKHISYENLALLLAQFIPNHQQILLDNLEYYFDKRGWDWNHKEQNNFKKYLANVWQKRKDLYLRKCFRTCTMTAYDQNFYQQSAFKRSFLDEVGDYFIRDIDELVKRGEVLKDGNSATVVKIHYAGKDLVIKRYNIKNVWHGLKRCYRPSRAAVSWRNTNLLELIGITTPKAFGFVEQRWGWLRKRAYLICEYTDGQELQHVYQLRNPTDVELEQLTEIFSLLRRYKISHGDLKASNLLLDNKGIISLIDLDAMQEHSNNKKLAKALEKDRKRFQKNWDRGDVKTVFERNITNNF
jgi:tRNA A-37 threonylcarbamoyl transferase component Bud32